MVDTLKINSKIENLEAYYTYYTLLIELNEID